MSGLSAIWAKSPQNGEISGELLTGHLAATVRAAVQIRDRVGELAAAPPRFWDLVRLAALLHDAGKVAGGFQAMVGNGPGPAVRWGERHEVLSLGFAAVLLAGLPEEERRWVALGILTHHRPLTSTAGRGLFGVYDEAGSAAFTARFGHIDPQAVRELGLWLAKIAADTGLLPGAHSGLPAPDGLGVAAHALLGELREQWQWRASREKGLAAVLMQGAVTLADHLSSAGATAGLHARQPIGSEYAKSLARTLRLHDHQQKAGAVDGHLLLRAPTGTGKTEAALLWAAQQVEALRTARGGQPRIFYTLPYLASINAMADRLGGSLGDAALIGVAHSRAGLYHLERSLHDDHLSSREQPDAAGVADLPGAAGKAASRAAATRLFRELVRVGTPYQLLRGALAGARCSGILIDSANSVFILDELHAYDGRRMGFILAMARFWEQLGGRIAVISATLPSRLAEMLDDALAAKVTRVEALDGRWPVRHRLAVHDGHLTSEESAALIEARLHAGQAVLAVANNVADARALFERLAPAARAHHGEAGADLLHARFRAMDRSAIEARIRDRYGTGGPRRGGLVVATQVVEVSLNVDFDALHTSGAPLDALIQRFGRVNRLGRRAPADVTVHTPAYRARRGGGADLWADGVYQSAPTELTMQILAGHHGAELSERHLSGWLDQVYGSAWGEEWSNDVAVHRRDFCRGFLRFGQPFDDRGDLQDEFDKLFDGVEAILDCDKEEYAAKLNSVDGAPGRLLGSQFLIPLPHYGRCLGHYDPGLKVTVIDAGYDPRSGLGEIHHRGGIQYQPGEIL